MGFCLFIWLVGCFLTSKQNTHGESFVFWSNSAPSPADFSAQAEKSAEGHSWLIRMPVVAHVDFRPLVALNLCVCVVSLPKSILPGYRGFISGEDLSENVSCLCLHPAIALWTDAFFSSSHLCPPLNPCLKS